MPSVGLADRLHCLDSIVPLREGRMMALKVKYIIDRIEDIIRFSPLNAELNPICCLLALLGAHHFLHVSRIRVKSLTLRLLMSYIYIYIYMTLVA